MSNSICSNVSKERSLKRAIRRLVLAEVDALQTERDSAIKLQDEANALLIEQARTNESLKQQRDELLSALEKIKMHSVSLADAQVVALEAIASVKEK